MIRRHFLLAVAGLCCAPAVAAEPCRSPTPIDAHATPETRNLLANMHALAAKKVMFGHQNTLAYGYGWTGDANRSDVKDVTGSYPAVYGWDLMDIFADGDMSRLDPVKADRLRAHVREAHARGGVNSFSWHMRNPATGGDAWDTTAAAATVLPGGSHHAGYVNSLSMAADFLASLRDREGRLIPTWFRPFHEQTGDWFWWGKGHTSPEDFKQLWQFTVGYLRDTRGLHNLLYAFSTDVFDSEAAYFEFYPGDAFTDLLGFDDYHSIKSPKMRAVFVRRLGDVIRWARVRGKLAALTETGLEALPDSLWWTGTLLHGLRAPTSTGLSYVLVWRNANPTRDRKEHFYAPYPGQRSAADFVRFRRDGRVAFEQDTGPLYSRPRACSE